MAVKDWPKPVRRMLGYAILALALGVSIGPLAILLLSDCGWDSLNAPGQVFVVYTAVIAGITAATVSGFVCWKWRVRIGPHIALYVILGAVIGLFVGLCMILPTLGASLFFAPPGGVAAALIVALVQRARRKSNARDSQATSSLDQ